MVRLSVFPLAVDSVADGKYERLNLEGFDERNCPRLQDLVEPIRVPGYQYNRKVRTKRPRVRRKVKTIQAGHYQVRHLRIDFIVRDESVQRFDAVRCNSHGKSGKPRKFAE